MSLQRQLSIIIFSGLSAFFVFKASFLLLQRFLIIPSQPIKSAEIPFSQSPAIPATFTTRETQLPTQLTISKQQINLPITPASIINGEWQLSTTGISLLQTQPLTDSAHGYILYGHNWPVLLGNLQRTRIGDTLSLSYTGGEQDNYLITSKFTVTPTQLDILNLAQPNTVLLYTCTGFMDSRRLIVLAEKQ